MSYRVSPVLQLGLIGALATALLFAVSHVAGAAPAHRKHALASHGTVARVETNGSRHVALLRSGKQLMLSERSLQTTNGHPLHTLSLRSGDRLDVLDDGTVIDRSQRWIQLNGLVASEPDGVAPLVVHNSWSGAFMVDFQAATTLDGTRWQPLQLSTIREADRLSVIGALDLHASEMTQTEAIAQVK